MVKFRIPFDTLRGVRRVGIQLPDGLKRQAFEIASILENKGFDVIISGETSFGACDVDLKLLEEVDVLLHFAHTQILHIDRVVYVPYFIDYNPKIDIEIPEKKVALISTAQYVHRLDKVAEWLEMQGYEVEIGEGRGRVKYRGQVLGCNYSVLKNGQADAVLFIGDGLFHAIGAAMYSGKKVYAFNPLTGELRVVSARDFVKKRYFIVSKCVGAEKAGIIVSSKPGQKRIELAKRLKSLGREKGLKVHIIYMNNVIAEELYNLPYEFYVNTACPRIAYDDAGRFEKPIITPQEFEFLIGLRDSIELDEIYE
ncbi:diphthamide biosynthesis enzyme Dph2 [Archaeoglobus neptunius]|uniref:diphthamide biosynthesis enzyme Dph2 n=1 Tax=Archaeoglobus neptunius TaxID=2798580 RepID=UPI001926CD35|nr:diphthamide biosynthesis enzyme Dph2 [Archaeoglobus neptunius]